MKLNLPTIIIVGVIAVFLLKRLLGGGSVSADVIREKIDSGAKIIDVRSPGEFASGAYPGAINIPVNELSRRLADLPKDKPFVLYCASGARSALAARTMKQAGFVDVVNAGGLSDMPR